MSTALSVSTTSVATVPGKDEWEALRGMAAVLSRSSMIPTHFRAKPDETTVALLMAREFGVQPLALMANSYIDEKGKLAIGAEMKLAIVQMRLPEFDYEVLERTAERCTVRGWIGTKTPKEITYTIDDAKTAGLFPRKDNWKNNPADMLYWMAMKRIVRMVAAFALVATPLTMLSDEDDEPNNGEAPPPPPARSLATIVEDAQKSAATAPKADAAPAAEEAQPTAMAWERKFYDLAAEHGWLGGKAVPDHKNALAKFRRAHAEEITRLANLMFERLGEPAVMAFQLIAPHDWERLFGALTKWAEGRKEAGGATEQAPATDGAPVGSNAPSPTEYVVGTDEPDDPDAPAETEALTPATRGELEELMEAGLAGLQRLFDVMRHAIKDEGAYYSVSAKRQGELILRDAKLLIDCGWTDDKGGPKLRWLSEVENDPAQWAMLCRAVLERKREVLK